MSLTDTPNANRLHIALFNDFPFTDQDGPQDTAFKVLDDLRALRRNDLPVGVGHLIDFGKVRPDAQNEEKEADMITHRLSMLELVDRLIVMEGGRIIADGPKNEVLRRLREQPAPRTEQ